MERDRYGKTQGSCWWHILDEDDKALCGAQIDVLFDDEPSVLFYGCVECRCIASPALAKP